MNFNKWKLVKASIGKNAEGYLAMNNSTKIMIDGAIDLS